MYRTSVHTSKFRQAAANVRAALRRAWAALRGWIDPDGKSTLR
jgi:hypothetical protein